MELFKPAPISTHHSTMRLFILSVLVAVAASQYTGPLPWGLDRIDQQKLPLNNEYNPYGATNGDQSIVYCMATGIERTHENFGPAFNRVELIYDFEGSDGTDTNGAGTAFAGIIGGLYTGVAQQATLGIVRINSVPDPLVLDSTKVIEGMTAILDHYKSLKAVNPTGHLRGIAVGAPSVPETATNLAQIEELMRDMVREGITVIGPVGDDVNAGAADCETLSPARLHYEPGMIIAGGLTDNDYRHPNSVVGGAVHCAHIYAPDHEIVSSVTANSYQIIPTETAFAAAHIGGAAARLRTTCPNLTEKQVKDFLIAGSRVHGNPALDLDGTPIPDRYILRVPYATDPAGDCILPA